MKKYFFLIIFFLFIFCVFKASAFWLFERERENNPKQFYLTVEDNGYVYQLSTDEKKVKDLLQEQKILVGDEDYLFPSEETFLRNGMKIIIKRALPVVIKADGRDYELKTFSRTVDEAIGEARLTLNRLDKVEPEKYSVLEKDLVIKITRVNMEEVIEKEIIEFETVEKDDPKLKWKKTRVDQEGENGVKEVKYRIIYTNGKQSSKVKLASVIAKKPVPKIIANGVKIEVGRVIKGRASWYAYTGAMVCASLQFPRGTWLRVTNQDTGRRVIVQVIDSGPYAKDKIIDLDKVAFQKIGDLERGVINVKVEEILE